MKKAAVFLAAAMLCLCFLGCEAEPASEISDLPEISEQKEQKEKIYEYIPAKQIDFADFQNKISEKRKEEIESESGFDGFEDYLVNDPDAKGILTKDEIKELKRTKRIKETVTAEEAKADIDILFRTFKYGYGAYYYFGGDEAFNRAKEEALEFVEGKDAVSVESLGKKLIDCLYFVMDAHFGVYGDSPANQNGVRFEYYYCTEHEFSKDERGFYKETKDGEKWYFSSCENPNISIEPYLTDDGRIIYAPVLFSPEKSELDNIELTFDGKTRTEEIVWKEGKSLSENPSREMDFNYFEENGLAFLSIRSFDQAKSSFDEFRKAAEKAKDEEILIFDLRGNGGGGGIECEWVGLFSGTNAEIKRIVAERLTGFSHEEMKDYGRERYNLINENGIFIPNDTAVIVLMDDNCGSAGESMLLALKTMENVTVIGGNSGGYQICGHKKALQLPNSGIDFYMGTALGFSDEMINVDGKGYKPDIWCNPKTSLEAVLKMIENYGLKDSETVSAIAQKTESR